MAQANRFSYQGKSTAPPARRPRLITQSAKLNSCGNPGPCAAVIPSQKLLRSGRKKGLLHGECTWWARLARLRATPTGDHRNFEPGQGTLLDPRIPAGGIGLLLLSAPPACGPAAKPYGIDSDRTTCFGEAARDKKKKKKKTFRQGGAQGQSPTP